MKTKTLAALFASVALLAACGSNDDGPVAATPTPVPAPGPAPAPAPATTDVSAAAQESISGLVAYLQQLISGSTNETSEPVLVGTATLPADETSEPAP